MYVDENKIKEELKIFLNHKLKGTSRVKKFILTSVIDSYVEEFLESIKTEYSCSDSESIKEGEDHVQSNSGGKQRVQELQTFIGSIRRVFKGYKRRYTSIIT